MSQPQEVFPHDLQPREGDSLPPLLPWEDPEISRLPALVRTMGGLLFRPREFVPRVGNGEGWPSPVAFGMVAGTMGFVACLFWEVVLIAGMYRLTQTTGGLLGMLDLGTGVVITLMLISPLIILINLVVGSLCLWAATKMAGKGVLDWNGSLRLYGYAEVGMVAGIVPLLGGIVGGIWTLILLYKGLKQIGGLPSGRAAGTLLLSVLLEVFLFVALIVAFFLGGGWFFLGLL